ncbi:hypothetical protein UFOVP449_197 [uncultured Caudovirales phage]|uniref:Uncharacterized protein n=1 Tax=uncultured Caudovirales phage TaxID=2100421 RepID=A0A6J5MDN7_9CAUD|nr:hypothetical protein UFOVP449_197 [uncultured Caudovirales phage]
MAKLKHTSPNFTVNAVNGWHTRLLYGFYGDKDTTFDYYVQTGGDYTSNLFSTIKTWEEGNTISSKGQYIYPQYSYFFKTGKSIRISGTLLVSADSGGVFNIYSKIRNQTGDSTYIIACQNNAQNHTFANSAEAGPLPVHFEITYGCVEDGGDIYMQSNGRYQYEYVDYNSGGTNTSNVYIPIWNATQYQIVGNTSDEYQLYISFDGSNATSIVVRHLMVEELS